MTDDNSGINTPQPPSDNTEAPKPPVQPDLVAAPAYPTPYEGSSGPVEAFGQSGPPGKIRSTGVSMLLYIVTLGIYSWFYYYKAHDEMKRHNGTGIGGAIALILAIFVSIVMPYIMSSEVGDLYERQGEEAPVTALTGLWVFPGCFILVGPIIWFVKTNNALNKYWESQGAHA